jgi:hypothetical protein
MDRKQGGGPSFQDVAEIVGAASLLVTCRVCGTLHRTEYPLDLRPICPACADGRQVTSLYMGGCYLLSEYEIDERVTRVSPGNYALGYLDDGSFLVFYVGRSDSDVNDRLHSWIDMDSKFTRYGPSAKAAHGSRRRHSRPLGTPTLIPVGVVVESRYTHFRFSYAVSAKAAFEKECCNYHDFGGSYGLDNERHPTPPEGEPWKCPEHYHHHRRW